MLLNKHATLVAVALATLTSCTGPIVLSESAADDNAIGVVSYYLPDRLHSLSFTREFIETEAHSNFFNRRKALEGALAAHEVLAAQQAQAKARLDSDPRSPELKMELARIEALIPVATAAFEAARSANDAATKLFNDSHNLANNCGFTDAFVLAPHGYVSHTGIKFSARLNHSIGRSDTLTLSTTSSGLLDSGNSVASDQSVEIIKAIASLVGASGGLEGALFAHASANAPQALNGAKDAGSESQKGAAACLKRNPFSHADLIDMADSSRLAAFQDVLAQQGALYQLSVRNSDGSILNVGDQAPRCKKKKSTGESGSGSQSATSIPESSTFSCGGLFYRRNLPYLLYARSNAKPAAILLFEMPNASSTEFVGYPTGALTDSKYTIDFDHGMLTSYKAERPSELLAGMTLPLNVVKAILSVPKDLLTLRYDNLDKQSDLSAAEVEALKQAYFLQQARLGLFPQEAPTGKPKKSESPE